MTGTPEGSTESGFMEKPRIEPATPGLQGIALIHYTTGAAQYGHIHGCQKSLAIQMPKLRKRAINILSFFLKKKGVYTWRR